MIDVGNNLFETPALENIPLSEILEENYQLFNYDNCIDCKGIPTGQTYIDEDGCIIDYQVVTADNHPGRLKYVVTADHLLISSIRLAKSPVCNFNMENINEYVFSNGFYIFKVKNGWDKRFVLYLLRSKRIKLFIDNNIYRGIGISAYRVEDFLKIEIKRLTIAEQQKAIEKIVPFEVTIHSLKDQIKSPQSIIDKVFAQEFGFDYTTFEALKNCKIHSIDFTAFANNPDLRFSTKFHRDAGRFVMKQLTGITSELPTSYEVGIHCFQDRFMYSSIFALVTSPAVRTA
jgi:type I restriction enzyme S subunit